MRHPRDGRLKDLPSVGPAEMMEICARIERALAVDPRIEPDGIAARRHLEMAEMYERKAQAVRERSVARA